MVDADTYPCFTFLYLVSHVSVLPPNCSYYSADIAGEPIGTTRRIGKHTARNNPETSTTSTDRLDLLKFGGNHISRARAIRARVQYKNSCQC